MKKVLLSSILVVLLVLSFSCTKKDSESNVMKIGMVTDSGTIDDKSFNQGTWEGIKRAESDLGVSARYLKPTGTTQSDYLKEILNLYDAGFRFIVTPGFKFETAIYKAQSQYKDAKFVLIDGAPHSGDYNITVGDNTVSIFFAEEEAGFYAAVAAALQLKNGEVGFIGGMEIPPVQKFNWGFQQGIAYANKTYNTEIVIKDENVIYQGSFDNVAAGQQLAAQMYDKGVKAIFCAAGGVGVGAINEAKSRAVSGEEVWIIGVDSDQYQEGIYQDDKSIILTSAVKRVDNAAYVMIRSELSGNFPGGQTFIFDSTNNGVGIPDKNPNLSLDVVKEVLNVTSLVQSGSIKISNTKGNLIK
ncbi:MAG: BMP family ABC transporter substrate-binding protein [Spirochaetales bacterium]|nr:BMP family ABC transporter substrate-binding protein [Spirochaetales bacterium]